MIPAESPINPWFFTDGDRNAEVLIVSEYASAEEEHKGKPLIGSAGFMFRKILEEAGIAWNSVLRTTISARRPRGNQIEDLFYPTPKKTPSVRGLYPTPAVTEGVTRVLALTRAMPNLKLIIGLGNLPLWLFTDKAVVKTSKGYKIPTGAAKWRGSQLYTLETDGRIFAYLPLVSPTVAMKDYSQKFYMVHDLKQRAVKFLKNPSTWTRDAPEFLWRPTYDEACDKLQQWEAKLSLGELKLSVDIETWKRRFISCIGLADATSAMCLPFFYFSPDGKIRDYFTADEETDIWLRLGRILQHPNAYIIGQNFIYDTQFIHRYTGIQSNLQFDTMLGHHLVWPGLPKGLDFLASLYCDHYIYWKDESQDWDGQFGHEDLWKYNCKDVRETYDIALKIEALIEKLSMTCLWQDRLEQWYLARDMMTEGIAVNRHALNTMNNELNKIAQTTEQWLLEVMPANIRYTAAGGPWFTSPKHQMMIFYDQLGLKPVLHKKTKRPTLDAAALAVLREQNPWLESLFQQLENLRSIAVFRSHFLTMQLSYDGRLRCGFNIAGTETFRWSSSANGFGEGTNFQNIPKGDE